MARKDFPRVVAVLASAVAVIAAGQAVTAVTSQASAQPAGPTPKQVTSKATPPPHGAVIVTLVNQHTDIRATQPNIARRKSTLRSDQNAVLSRDGITDSTKVIHYTLSNAMSLTVTSAQASRLAADPSVKSVVADTKIAVSIPPTTPAPTVAHGPAMPRTTKPAPAQAQPKVTKTGQYAVCPSNPSKPMLEPEALNTIGAATGTAKTSAQTYATGANVRVAVFAEPIDPTAPDFIRPNGQSAIVDYQNFSGAPDTAPNEAYGEEIFGDASTIAAQGSVVHDLSSFVNAGHPLPTGCNIQIRGVAPGADVVALKVLSSSDTGTSYAIASDLAQAIDYAVTVDHVDVLSESVGAMGTPDSATADAVQQFNDLAVAAGVTVVASAGDAGPTGTIGGPAADPQVIAAAASTTLRADQQVQFTGTSLSNGKWVNGNISPFSSGGFTSTGTVPVLTAPGDVGWAACTDKTNLPGCTTYATDSNGNPLPSPIELFGGTSQSAPMIAGTAALVIQAYRNAHQGTSPTPALVRQILASTATDLGAPGSEQGAGQINALAAVKLAMTYQAVKTAKKSAAPGAVAGSGLLLSTDQVTDVAAQGTAETNTATVTNTTAAGVTLHPAINQLVPIAAPSQTTVQLDPTTDPSFTGPTGLESSYTTSTFKVKAGTDQLAIALAYPSAARFESGGGQPQVYVSLLNPSGAYVLNSRPQGGTSSSNYGNLDVVRPATGKWTAVFSTTPTTDNPFGTGTLPVDAYSGPVTMSVTPNAWTSAGTVTPSTVKLAAGKSATLTAHTRMPLAAGDSVLTLSPGAPAQVNSSAISLIQRVTVGVQGGHGQFTGGLTGGNGRAQQPAQQQSYAIDVPAGQASLDVALKTSAAASIPGVLVSLVDPNGQVQSTQNNGDPAASKAAVSRIVTDDVADPTPGRWRLIIRTVSPSSGLDLVVPFTGTVDFGRGPVTSTGLSSLAPAAATVASLPGGQITDETATITNTSGVTQTYYADPRTSQVVSTTVAPTLASQMPASSLDVLTRDVLLPPNTSSLSATLSSTLPLQTQLSGPSSPLTLSGPDALGPPAQPVDGTATSTATMSVPSGSLTTGNYQAIAGSVGPFGPDGAPTGAANGTATATTLGFDPDVTVEGGDPFVPGTDPTTATGVSVPAGQTATVTMRVRPSAAVGTTVSGTINIVELGNDSPYSLATAPGIVSTDQVVAAFPYRYAVGTSVPSITGTLSDNGTPITGVKAIAYDATGTVINYALSDASGKYVLSGLPAGTYTLCFDTNTAHGPAKTGYADSCYQNQTWDGSSTPPATATKVTVSSAATGPVTGISQTLIPSSGVQGTITNNAGTPLGAVNVRVYSTGGTQIAQTSTADDGTYQILGISPSNVIVCANPTVHTSLGANGGYANECDGHFWNAVAPTPGEYPTVILASGVISTVNGRLDTLPQITGTITDTSGAAAQGIVQAFNTTTGATDGAAVTNADGTYAMDPDNAGTYDLCVFSLSTTLASTCYQSEPWSGSAPAAPGSTPVTIALNTTTSGVNIALLAKSNPSGTAAIGLARLAKANPALAKKVKSQLR